MVGQLGRGTAYCFDGPLVWVVGNGRAVFIDGVGAGREGGTGRDLDGFYGQFVSGTSRVDYGILSLSYKAVSGSEAKYDVDVTVERRLDGFLPQTISLTGDDGSRIDTLWTGEERTKVFRFQTSSKPKYAELNAGNGYAIDENIANNTLYYKSLGSRLLSFEWDSVFLMELIFSLIL